MLTDFQKRKLSRYFRVYDVDDDGAIGPADFERVIENLRILHGIRIGSPQHIKLRDGYARRWDSIRSSADTDESGTIDLDEWLAYWDGVLGDDERYEAEVATLTTRLFDTFDTDQDGVIGADEFCNFYSAYGLSAALARRVFLDLDLDGDGAISREELLEMARQFYRGDDPAAPGTRLFGPPDA